MPGPENLLHHLFGNAKKTATDPSYHKESMTALTCKGCGAARPDGTDIRICSYCGYRFLTEAAQPDTVPSSGQHLIPLLSTEEDYLKLAAIVQHLRQRYTDIALFLESAGFDPAAWEAESRYWAVVISEKLAWLSASPETARVYEHYIRLTQENALLQYCSGLFSHARQ